METRNCWEYFGCQTSDCPANNPTFGRKCWRVAVDHTDSIPSGVKIVDGYKVCWECSYFKAMHPDIISGLAS